jgi:cation:H+ antiporter
MDWMILVLLIGGFTALMIGAEILVRGASRLAAAIGISPLVIGLTVVAFGTSAPELAINIQAAFKGQGALALGNVVGSNIMNVLVILGLSALIIPLVVNKQLVRLDVPIMIAVTLLAWWMTIDGLLGRFDGIILFSGLLVYIIYSIIQSRKESKNELGTSAPKEKSTPRVVLMSLGQIVVGLFGLTLGSDWLVDGAVQLASFFGISEMVIGLTIVAVGTSLPELATSVVAAMRNERDIAVGNVVGSNIFNIMSVLGLTSLIAPNGVPIPQTALAFDIPVMVAVAVICLPVFFSGGYTIGRWEGGMFLGLYLVYLGIMLSDAVGGTSYQSEASLFILLFVILVFVVTAFYEIMNRRKKKAHGV